MMVAGVLQGGASVSKEVLGRPSPESDDAFVDVHCPSSMAVTASAKVLDAGAPDENLLELPLPLLPDSSRFP